MKHPSALQSSVFNLSTLGASTVIALALLPTESFAGPPLPQGDGSGPISVHAPAIRPICEDITPNFPYPKHPSKLLKARPDKEPSTGGGVQYIEYPAIPGALKSWSMVMSGTVKRYCVQPQIVNTNSGATPKSLQVFFIDEKDNALQATALGGSPRSATVAGTIAPKSTVEIAETWCIDLPATQDVISVPTSERPNQPNRRLGLFINVPAQNLLGMIEENVTSSASQATAPNSAQRLDITGSAVNPRSLVIQEYSTACALTFSLAPPKSYPPVKMTFKTPQPRVGTSIPKAGAVPEPSTKQ